MVEDYSIDVQSKYIRVSFSLATINFFFRICCRILFLVAIAHAKESLSETLCRQSYIQYDRSGII